MVSTRFAIAFGSLLASNCVSALTWNSTKYLFTFGDSYTTSGYNVSAGIDSPNPGWTSSNGPNWALFLTQVYHIIDTKLYNLAYGGAVIDSKLVGPSPIPQVCITQLWSVVDQVGLWTKNFGPHPAAAPWTSADSLFAIWIGINDINNSWWWNVNHTAFYTTLMDQYFAQVDVLYTNGARSFLFVNVPPLERTPLFIGQGQQPMNTIKALVTEYNAQLAARVKKFTASHQGLGQVTLFDANKLFNVQLNNAKVLGFVNVTGYNDAYIFGTPGWIYQAPGSKPVSSYFWLNALHPGFFVHNVMAFALSTILA